MQDTKIRKVWYGTKTFQIIKGFIYQGVIFSPNCLFACDKETHEKYGEFLGKEYLEKPEKEVEVIKEVKKEIPKSGIAKIVSQVKKK